MRRAVLARRRLLAAVLAAVAVTTGVRAATAPPPASVTVTVAARDLPAGTVLADDDLTTYDLPTDAVPEGLAPDPVGRILAAPVARGEPLVTLRLVGPGLTAGHPELSALPVRLPDAAMTDLLRVGDRIDLVATDPQAGTAHLVAAGVTVLALPRADPEPSATGLAGSLVVVGVPPDAVEDISSAAVTGFLTFAFSR